LALNNATSNVFPIWFNAGGGRQLGPSSVLFLGVLGDGFGHFLLLVALASLALIAPGCFGAPIPACKGRWLAVCLFVYGFVYYGQFRYQIPMEPLMILVATPLIVSVWTRREALLRN
jgi:hypothetical protein